MGKEKEKKKKKERGREGGGLAGRLVMVKNVNIKFYSNQFPVQLGGRNESNTILAK